MKTAGMLILALAAAPCSAQRPLPWIDSDTRVVADNQPRTHIASHLEYGRYLSDNTGFAMLVDVEHAFSDDAATTTAAPGLMLFAAAPSLRLGASGAVRAMTGAPGAVTALWVSRANLNLGRGVQLRGRAERERYLATTASLDTLVVMRALELLLDRANEPGWAGVVAARREDFRDDNIVFTAYGWVLAPLARATTRSLRIGYAASWQDAEESRWVTLPDQRPPRGPSATPGAIIPGHYDPYYTPHDQLTHSVLLDAALATGRGWLKLSGAIGRTSEIVPVRRNVGQPDDALEFGERTFTPYRAAANWWTPLGDMTSLTLEVEYSRTAFYNAARARARIARSL